VTVIDRRMGLRRAIARGSAWSGDQPFSVGHSPILRPSRSRPNSTMRLLSTTGGLSGLSADRTENRMFRSRRCPRSAPARERPRTRRGTGPPSTPCSAMCTTRKVAMPIRWRASVARTPSIRPIGSTTCSCSRCWPRIGDEDLAIREIEAAAPRHLDLVRLSIQDRPQPESHTSRILSKEGQACSR